jgi:tRNA(Ile)-lysidine synthase
LARKTTVSDQLRRRVLESIRRHCIVPPGARLVVAVSGGPDSVCLVHALRGLITEADIELHVAHLDHQLRGANARADAEYVRSLAESLGLASTIESRDVQSYRSKKRISVEEAAREVRYAFLADVTRSVGASAVVVGHTLDDNVETILMHLLRGTGTKGLRGLQPISELGTPSGSVKVIRPLLGVSRDETEAYCREQGLKPRVDESNRSMSLMRNRVRLELLPVLRRYNPGVVDALTRIGKIATDESDYLDQETALVWEKVAHRAGDNIVLARGGVLDIHPALQRQVLRRAVSEFVRDLKDIEARHIDELLRALHSPSGRVFELPGGLIFVVERDRYLLGRNAADLCPFPPLDGAILLNVPGETVTSGWRVEAAVGEGEMFTGGSPRPLPGEAFYGGVETAASVLDPCVFVQCFDYDRAGDKLGLRAAQPGDRFQPLGLHGSKKVREFMIDAGIPRSWRSRIPVVVNPGGVVWVVGCRIDERVKVTEAGRRILRLAFRRLA